MKVRNMVSQRTLEQEKISISDIETAKTLELRIIIDNHKHDAILFKHNNYREDGTLFKYKNGKFYINKRRVPYFEWTNYMLSFVSAGFLYTLIDTN